MHRPVMAAHRWPGSKSGSTPVVHAAVARPSARQIRWTASPAPPWYFLRFPNPDYEAGPFDPAAVRYWLPVDTYVGGAEHAVMHLLYARFWTKVLYDAGHINFVEPFSRLRNQGVLHAPDGNRMSKSRGNVITPDEVIARHGTDALRTYILFLGPFEGNVTWSERDIKGVTRFLERFWALALAMLDQPAPDSADKAEETRLIKENAPDYRRLFRRYGPVQVQHSRRQVDGLAERIVQ